MSEIAVVEQGELSIYDPDKGLKTIAVAEAGEKHWARAKDATKLCEAIQAKLKEQAKYAVWRGTIVEPSQDKGAPGRGKRVAVPKPVLPAADPGKVIVHRWRKKLCRKKGKGWEIDSKRLDAAFDDASHRAIRICEQENANTIRGTEGTGEFERYTPEEYIDAARSVLGEIDLDPATSAQAQQTVCASEYFTVEDDGLGREWHGRVWLNPPYHRELAPKFIDKLVEEYIAGRVAGAVMLTNNCADTDWFDVAVRACAGICFTHGRIKFTEPNGEEVLPTQGQTFFYFGADVERFEDVFCAFGFCVRVSRQYEVASCMVDSQRAGAS
jgi:phage N-6-adenine-methyltransferase